ncbi:hypothetical protein AAHE18_01G097700 [Arachis hypogaea]
MVIRNGVKKALVLLMIGIFTSSAIAEFRTPSYCISANDVIKLQECIKRCQRRWYKRDFLEMVACMGVCWHGMDPWRTRGDPYG